MTQTQRSGPGIGPDWVLERIGRLGVVAVIRSPTAKDALLVSRVLLDAGIEALEVTLTTPDAVGVVATLRHEAEGGVLVGAGTVTSADDAQRAADVGADFLVSPGNAPSVTEAMLATGLLALPGVLTPTELMHARSLGIRAVKLFPACQVGPGGLRALLGPFPEVTVVPTGGISAEEVPKWLDSGAHAVGLGTSLVPRSLPYGEVEQLAGRTRRLIEDVTRVVAQRS